jgi:hypothetical protein
VDLAKKHKGQSGATVRKLFIRPFSWKMTIAEGHFLVFFGKIPSLALRLKDF